MSSFEDKTQQQQHLEELESRLKEVQRRVAELQLALDQPKQLAKLNRVLAAITERIEHIRSHPAEVDSNRDTRVQARSVDRRARHRYIRLQHRLQHVEATKARLSAKEGDRSSQLLRLGDLQEHLKSQLARLRQLHSELASLPSPPPELVKDCGKAEHPKLRRYARLRGRLDRTKCQIGNLDRSDAEAVERLEDTRSRLKCKLDTLLAKYPELKHLKPAKDERKEGKRPKGRRPRKDKSDGVRRPQHWSERPYQCNERLCHQPGCQCIRMHADLDRCNCPLRRESVPEKERPSPRQKPAAKDRPRAGWVCTEGHRCHRDRCGCILPHSPVSSCTACSKLTKQDRG